MTQYNKNLILKSTANKSMSDDIDLLAVGATFDEIDKEGEIIKSGAIAEGKVSIGSWGHSSIPAGVGDIKQVEKQLILEGKFFDTQMGRDTREIVKELSEVLEWSIGCLLYTSPSPRDRQKSRMPSSA